jgi:hypothetical protein
MKLEFIKEGHYREDDKSYWSIWAFKREHGISPNDNQTNYKDAININCNDKKWLPFNQSNRFTEGWHFEESFLVIYFGLC